MRSPIASNRGPARWPPSPALSPTRSGRRRVPKDGRKIGVVVHHVATHVPAGDPAGADACRRQAGGGRDLGRRPRDECRARQGVRRRHAERRRSICFGATARQPRPRSGLSATRSSIAPPPVSLNADAPLTCQFMLEDHAVRHSYHHLARIRAALKKARSAAQIARPSTAPPRAAASCSPAASLES